jgi:hypothetical protein
MVADRLQTAVRMPQMSPWRLATGPTLQNFRWLAALGRAVQDASERSGHLARLERLGEHFTDARGERTLRQAHAAIAAHQHNRQLGPMMVQHTRESRPGEAGHDFIGDDDVEALGRGLECGERDAAIGE